ncbi:bestrophin-like domain [Polyangium jinanense]|uniref:DUF4239 domain-containing protein n=1 Tax=Polyangium jinanense TaxID=2829994 RepID=A0A9X3XFJ5_9BACT|nr:DUF4239 domain-containing protein [Polyangium jinanense]MDC3957004.1 DUF4239 domain-containing protein [Polyangium jinanense]MDC3987161.1 DUF4239 domain-containing protein [Polyangium jinanense]
MFAAGPLDQFPLWMLLGGTIVTLLLAVEGGYRLGTYRLRRSEQEHGAHVLALVTTTMGLLALVLAFTFNLAANRFEARKQIVVDEANTIETTYLRAGLLPGDRGAKVREMLREYVDVRLEAVRLGNVEHALRRSEELHRELWKEAESVGRDQPESTVVGLFIQSLNRTIELHAMRVKVAVRGGIPDALWAALYLIAILNLLAVGYHAGLVKTPRSPTLATVVMSLSVVLMLTADLDHPQEGAMKVSQQAMIDVRRTMGP